MLLEDGELREIITRTSSGIELRNSYGRCSRVLSRAEALGLDLSLFIGVGNRRRVKFIRPRTQVFALNTGSRTTRRLRSEGGINIAHPLIREHKPPGPGHD